MLVDGGRLNEKLLFLWDTLNAPTPMLLSFRSPELNASIRRIEFGFFSTLSLTLSLSRSIYLSLNLSLYPFPSKNLSPYLSICISIYVSISLSLNASIYFSIYRSISLLSRWNIMNSKANALWFEITCLIINSSFLLDNEWKKTSENFLLSLSLSLSASLSLSYHDEKTSDHRTTLNKRIYDQKFRDWMTTVHYWYTISRRKHQEREIWWEKKKTGRLKIEAESW